MALSGERPILNPGSPRLAGEPPHLARLGWAGQEETPGLSLEGTSALDRRGSAGHTERISLRRIPLRHPVSPAEDPPIRRRGERLGSGRASHLGASNLGAFHLGIQPGRIPLRHSRVSNLRASDLGKTLRLGEERIALHQGAHLTWAHLTWASKPTWVGIQPGSISPGARPSS